ncbi:MAG: PqqD family protein [Desulfobacteraceae bacterium]|nr:PqqD family protein [Desulfobacteraceae bacterium]MBC2718175.1 PqqD family protein [Desulfobacteraceae bacterium]
MLWFSDIDKRGSDDYAILFSKQLQKVVESNETGAKIIQLIDGNLSVKDIAAKLEQLYEIDTDTLLSHVVGFIEVLSQTGFEIDFK